MESLMDQITDRSTLEREPLDEPARPRRRTWRTAAVGTVALLALVALYLGFGTHKGNQAVALAPPAMPVTVSQAMAPSMTMEATTMRSCGLPCIRVDSSSRVDGVGIAFHPINGEGLTPIPLCFAKSFICAGCVFLCLLTYS